MGNESANLANGNELRQVACDEQFVDGPVVACNVIAGLLLNLRPLLFLNHSYSAIGRTAAPTLSNVKA